MIAIVVGLIIIIFLMWILDGYCKDREEFEQEMLEKETVNQTMNVFVKSEDEKK